MAAKPADRRVWSFPARIASRGLALGGFGIGIAIPAPTDVGDSIQGNFIGPYLAYPVDQGTGDPLPGAKYGLSRRVGKHPGRNHAGEAANATVGGFNPDENNVISGNGAQGVLLLPPLRQPGAGQSDRRRRTVYKRALFPGRQRGRRGMDPVVGDRGQSRKHRLFVE